MPIFFVIFNLILMCHLSGQEAFFVGSLTRDPSLIWNIVWKQYCSIVSLLAVVSHFLHDKNHIALVAQESLEQ